VGEVTPAGETQFGYHIIKVERMTPRHWRRFARRSRRNLKQSKLHAVLDALKDNAHPVYDDKYFAPPPPPRRPQGSSEERAEAERAWSKKNNPTA